MIMKRERWEKWDKIDEWYEYVSKSYNMRRTYEWYQKATIMYINEEIMYDSFEDNRLV